MYAYIWLILNAKWRISLHLYLLFLRRLVSSDKTQNSLGSFIGHLDPVYTDTVIYTAVPAIRSHLTAHAETSIATTHTARSLVDCTDLVICIIKSVQTSVRSAIVNMFPCIYFYRAMHFSAKRGIAIACRLSVRPSVRLSVCLWRWWIVNLWSHRLEFFWNNFTVS